MEQPSEAPGSYFYFVPLFWFYLSVPEVCFPVIFPLKISDRFLSTPRFSVLKCANREAGAGFFSALVKSIATWVDASAEESPGIVFCCKCRLYDTFSAQLPVLCTSLVSCSSSMCNLCWVLHEL